MPIKITQKVVTTGLALLGALAAFLEALGVINIVG